VIAKGGGLIKLDKATLSSACHSRTIVATSDSYREAESTSSVANGVAPARLLASATGINVKVMTTAMACSCTG
jgi:hypothetical protein